MNPENNGERRTESRTATAGAIPICVRIGPKLGEGLLLDITETGAFVLTDMALEKRDMVLIDIDIPGQRQRETVQAMVTRWQEGRACHFSGLGVAFVWRNASERAHVQQVVQTVLGAEHVEPSRLERTEPLPIAEPRLPLAKSGSSDDRRAGTRVETEGSIPIQVTAGGQRGRGLLLDINSRGAFVFTNMALRHAEMVGIEIEIPGAFATTSLRGVIARHQTGGNGRAAGLGVEFVWRTVLEKQQIQDVVRSILTFELLGRQRR